MNLEELISAIFKKVNKNTDSDKIYTKTEIREVYKAFIDVVKELLEDESELLSTTNKREIKINIPLIGRFNIIRQDSYIGKNPKTKEKVKVSANNRIYYSPYKAIKNAINNRRKI